MNELKYAASLSEDQIQGYLESRLENQIQLHDNKSRWNYKWHLALGTFELVVAVIITLLVSFTTESDIFLKILAGILALFVVIVSGILTLYRFQENWVKHLSITKLLQAEKFLFLTKSGPYSRIEATFSVLAERVEKILLVEVDESGVNKKKYKELF